VRDAVPDHWFEPLADHLGSAYLRYSFTRGTANEVAFLVEHLGLAPGDRVLDVGCGPGRHALALGAQGIEVLGVDVAQRFVDLGTQAAVEAEVPVRFARVDARALPFDGEFDAVISLCQGAFGLAGGGPAGGGPAGSGSTPVDPDGVVLDGMARALRPGGRLAVSAFSAYFQLRYLEDADTFDADAGVNHERTSVRDEQGAEAEVDLWTTCFTPRELRLLAARAGLVVDHVYSVTPGAYVAAAPTIETPELLLLASRPG
jgi:SAM-dependent methyltransferase